jgi:SYP5 family syntaxin
MNRSEKEMNRRKDNLANLRSKVNQMASTLNMSNFANRDSLLGPEIKPDAMSRTVGLDNNGLVGLQRQVMKGNLILNCVNIEIYNL